MFNKKLKKLSVITICYNEPDVQKTCESIVNQNWQDFDWIVVDGGYVHRNSVLYAYRRRYVEMKPKTFVILLIVAVVVCLLLTAVHFIYAVWAFPRSSIIEYIAKELW